MKKLFCLIFLASLSASGRETRTTVNPCLKALANKKSVRLQCRQTFISDKLTRSGERFKNPLQYAMTLWVSKTRIRVKLNTPHVDYISLDKTYSFKKVENRWEVDLTDNDHPELTAARLELSWNPKDLLSGTKHDRSSFDRPKSNFDSGETIVTYSHLHLEGLETVQFLCK